MNKTPFLRNLEEGLRVPSPGFTSGRGGFTEACCLEPVLVVNGLWVCDCGVSRGRGGIHLGCAGWFMRTLERAQSAALSKLWVA